MSNIVRYAGDVSRGPSVNLWGDLAKWEADMRMGNCAYIYDDFLYWGSPTTNATTHGVGLGWTVVLDDGVLLKSLATASPADGEFGVLHLDGADADNDFAYMILGANTGGLFKFDDALGKICFEIKLKKVTVADGKAGFCAGLFRYDMAADATLADNGAAMVATADFVGFNQTDADGDAVIAGYQATGQTKQDLTSTDIPLTADTWIKLGFIYDPKNKTEALKFYVNGALYSTTAVNNGSGTQGISAATFPNDIVVSPMFGFKIDGANEEDMEIDWIAAGQYLQ